MHATAYNAGNDFFTRRPTLLADGASNSFGLATIYLCNAKRTSQNATKFSTDAPLNKQTAHTARFVLTDKQR